MIKRYISLAFGLFDGSNWKNWRWCYLFLPEGLTCSIGDDLDYGTESLWLQLNRLRCRPRIIGCVSGPPNQCMDEFLGNMNYSLSSIHPNHDKVFPAILMLISHLPPEMQTFY